MRVCLAVLAMLLFANPACCADADCKQSDEDLRGYMVGEYDLIGRKSDSTATYSGHVTLRDENGVLQVTRTIEGKTNKCVARFGTVGGDDRIPVLKMHFHFDGKEYDATYRWQSDPDNYPRFTGFVYLADTKSPGLEALFPVHKQPRGFWNAKSVLDFSTELSMFAANCHEARFDDASSPADR